MAGGVRLGGTARDLRAAFEVGTAGGLGDGALLDRFALGGDQAAFAALVERHGPMVRATCRGILGSRDDAEDAFQATFLILSLRAGTLRRGESLAGWLHRVARRVSIRAGVARARRAALEARATPARPDAGSPGPWDDVLPLLHQEIGRLPEKYRAPIVLCDLEGLTRDEAAGQLGWPPGTVAGRLARGRDLLRARLGRRGVAPSVATLALAWSARRAGASALPRGWAEAATRAATEPVAGTPSAAANLAKGTMAAMLRSALLRGSTLALAAGLVLLAAASLLLARDDPRPTIGLSGLVVDVDGRAAADVEVVASTRSGRPRWGEVVARTRTGGDGRFRLDLPTRDGEPARADVQAVWAYRPGRLLASLVLGGHSITPDVPVKLALGPPSLTGFEVRDPAGRPVVGASILPRVLHRDHLSIPDGLADRIGATTVTNLRGRATLAALLPEEVGTVVVAAPGFGAQQFGAEHAGVEPGRRVLQLSPVGRLEGRIVGDPAFVRRRTLTAVAYSKARPAPPAAGFYDLTTDEAGRFAIPEVVAGTTWVWIEDLDPASPWYGQAGPVEVEPGRTVEMTLTMTRAVAIRGSVRERGTDRPIAGVRIGFGIASTASVATDEAGRFSGYAQPGFLSPQLMSIPEGFTWLMYGLPDARIPDGATEHELPPIELTPSRAVRGSVVDAGGKPVAGARVDASWPVDEGPSAKGPRKVEARTDARGEFRIDRIPVAAPVTLRAGLLDLRTAADVVVAARSVEPARLPLEPGRTLAMAGRVLDGEGVGIAGARVHLRARRGDPGGRVEGDDPVRFDGVTVLPTDAEGRFRTPPLLEPEVEYAAHAEADGFEPARTFWTPGKTGRFPDLTLNPVGRAGTIEGQVLDRRGGTVARATVRVEGRSPLAVDARGRFRFDGLPLGRTIVFVDAPGYRFEGRVVAVPSGEYHFGLNGLPDAPAEFRATLPPALPRAEEVALAARVLEPGVARVLKQGRPDELFLTLQVLAAIDPARTLAIVADGKVAAPFADRLRAQVARSLGRTGPEAAAAVVEAIEDPFLRADALLAAADALPPAERAGKLDRIARALGVARGGGATGDRIAAVAAVAGHWLDLGEDARGAALLREFEPGARALAGDGMAGSARGRFAAELARVDPDGGLALFDGIRGGDSPDRHRLRIAQELASRDPGRAEAVLAGLADPEALRRNLPRIAHAMARIDPARADRLADRVSRLADPSRVAVFAVPHARVLIGLASAEADRPFALDQVARAYADLARLVGTPFAHETQFQDASTVAAGLLPVVEQVAPTLLTEYFWKAAGLAEPPPTADRGWVARRSALALFLARYDRAAASVVLAPALASTLDPVGPAVALAARLRAEAAIDPARAVGRFEALPDDPDPDPSRSPKEQARLALAGFLAADPIGRWDAMTRQVLKLWTVVEGDGS